MITTIATIVKLRNFSRISTNIYVAHKKKENQNLYKKKEKNEKSCSI